MSEQDRRDVLVAAGSIALADGTPANVAEFAIANQTWSAVGDSAQLPGPVTAMEVNNGNTSSIFAAGRCVEHCAHSFRLSSFGSAGLRMAHQPLFISGMANPGLLSVRCLFTV